MRRLTCVAFASMHALLYSLQRGGKAGREVRRIQSASDEMDQKEARPPERRSQVKREEGGRTDALM